ncbi:right-handed parallel beta-helix repeat-containing protein [Pyxidicoccus fallax]|uniref:Right-handed parallel beta-helix repeat-containing protein n=1 Tax=Pyxidicoccus fallax TaxID=394095 RepID=A0A848L4A5_9BACT|nr:right-handed parallel beta-helix repeat-containing protein [Pyxidicoccus fallax]NMO13544.1 right-handed parallel beta-helix repeat-containing protein [Pyxidicoccus fallax]NPC76748.1 right-handed parallel beta-helix repeat-containing protein [Pyxidicoccus fallax]
MRTSLLAVALGVLVTACSSSPGARPDGVSPEDSGTPDGVEDAGLTPDAGTEDAGTEDAGTEDAGTNAGADAGTDAGADAGADGGADAGPVIPVPADGGTIVTSTLSGRLTLAGSPYRVVGDANGVVTIPRGQRLTVEPGVILDFRGRPEVTEADVDASSPHSVMNHQRGRVELRAYGAIHIQGTAQQPVLLTSTNPYGWWGVNFYGENSVGAGHPVFEHMVFEKVRKNQYNGERDWTRGAMWAYYPGPVTITNSVFRDNESSAHCAALDLMFTDGSRIENTVFENNRLVDIDRFAQPNTYSMAGGGALCITHGRNSVVRGNTFRDNTLKAYRGYLTTALEPRPLLTYPNPQGIVDLGGGGAILYFQPENDLLEDNLFEGNEAVLGPGGAIYLEDVNTRTVTMRRNRFVNNRSGAGGTIVCNRGAGGVELVVTADNVFIGNTLNGQPAANLTGDCDSATQ